MARRNAEIIRWTLGASKKTEVIHLELTSRGVHKKWDIKVPIHLKLPRTLTRRHSADCIDITVNAPSTGYKTWRVKLPEKLAKKAA